MYGELASVRQSVDLSSQELLDKAESFLVQQGYSISRRTGTALTAERRSPDLTSGQAAPNLTVYARSQLGGGVKVAVMGNDQDGIKQRQAEWQAWSESLPKKVQHGSSDASGSSQRPTLETPPVPLSPPEQPQAVNLPQPPTDLPFQLHRHHPDKALQCGVEQN